MYTRAAVSVYRSSPRTATWVTLCVLREYTHASTYDIYIHYRASPRTATHGPVSGKRLREQMSTSEQDCTGQTPQSGAERDVLGGRGGGADVDARGWKDAESLDVLWTFPATEVTCVCTCLFTAHTYLLTIVISIRISITIIIITVTIQRSGKENFPGKENFTNHNHSHNHDHEHNHNNDNDNNNNNNNNN